MCSSPWLCFIRYTYMCWVSMGGMAVTDKPYQCCVCVCVCVREHSYTSKALIDTDVSPLVENISYCDLVCHLWQRSIIQWVAFFRGSRYMCVCVCMCTNVSSKRWNVPEISVRSYAPYSESSLRMLCFICVCTLILSYFMGGGGGVQINLTDFPS